MKTFILYHIRRFLLFTISLALFSSCSVNSEKEFYTVGDFPSVPKIDAHFHYNTTDTRYLKFADSLNMWFVSPNVDAGRSIDEQFSTASMLKKEFGDKFLFLGTFPVDNFGKPDFAGEIIERIEKAMKYEASGIKIWKNIGMELKDQYGDYVMIDDPAFHPVFEYLQEKGIPVLGHLGEPLNCWLPLDEMTLGNDRRYFQNNPQYHMYLHPEAPSYDDQITARDNILDMYPGLKFSGAHLASLEWSVDELAERFESFPELKVDLSARIGHLQYQSLENPDRVRDFMIKYQDRIMYGSDMSVSERSTDYGRMTANLHQRWMDDWIYLATDSAIVVNDLEGQKVAGLKLPASVIDKIFFTNSRNFFSY